MAQLRLTGKGIFLMVIILSLISFGLGFGIWQLAGPKTYDPTASSAAGTGNPASGCYKGDIGCKGTAQACCTQNDVNNKRNGCTSVGQAYCTNYALYHCCDGAWVTGAPGGKTDTICSEKGHKCTSNQVSQDCLCDSYANCGVNCRFDADVQTAVNKAVVGTCGKRMAFCEIDSKGNTKVVIKDPGSCWAQRSVCKNPTAEDTCAPEVNVCDGGAVITPASSGNYNVGEIVKFTGYAFDKDGINKNKVVIKVDGVIVGNASVKDHPCASATADAICTAAGGRPAVEWEYTYTVTKAGAHSFSASWEDTKGVTGASCAGSRNITANVQTNPSWEITKSGSGVCVDQTAGNQKARVDYTITIKNVGDGTGQIENLVDTLDNKVEESYITRSSITPSASVSGRVITWDLAGTSGQFDPNESMTFKYSIIIPASAFGTLTNTAVATPNTGEAFQATEIVMASCNPAEIPETALFDSSLSKVVLGLILLTISGTYLYSNQFEYTTPKKVKNMKKYEDSITRDF